MSDTVLISIYIEALKLAQRNGQIVGGDNQYFITVQQLENIIKKESVRSKS